MTWRDLTPSQRCRRLSARLRGDARGNRSTEQWSIRVARARRRREQLEDERQDWLRLTLKFTGRLHRISAEMGCAEETARFALWDLGLWPLVVRLRTEALDGIAHCHDATGPRSDVRSSRVQVDLDGTNRPVTGEYGGRAAQ